MQHKFVMGKIQGDPLNQLQQAMGPKFSLFAKKKKRKTQFVCKNKKDESKCSPVTHHIKDGGYVVQ